MPNTVPVLSTKDSPLQTFIYSRIVPDMAVNIAFVETETIVPSCVININESLNLFSENKDFYSTETEYLDDGVKSYAVKSKYFRISNKFNSYNELLFYRHKLVYPAWVNQYEATKISIHSNNGGRVDPKSYHYDSQTATIYHNLANSYDSIYYVEYTQADDNNNIVDNKHEEILNSLEAFIPIDYTMLTCVNKLSMHANGYIISVNKDVETKRAYPYIITLPTLGKWGIQYISGEGLRLHYPAGVDYDRPWHLLISYDYIERVYEYALDGQNNPYIYTVLEYNNQYFNPYPPYTLIKLEKAEYIDSMIIKVAHTNLLVEINYPLEILVTDARGSYKYAFSTNLEQSSSIAPDIEWLPIDTCDIDKSSGFINLRVPISFTDICNVTYFYSSKFYPFTAKDFNPRFDNAVFMQNTIIYCKPIVVDWDAAYPLSSTLLANKSIYYIIFHMDAEGSIYDDALHTPSYTCNDPDLHIDSGDLDSDIVSDANTKDKFLANYAYPNGKRWLVLGNVTAMHPSSINDAVVLDSRSLGGGLKHTATDNTYLHITRPETRWYWDCGFWDGQSFPGAAAVVVSLPNSILDSYTEDEISAKIKKHIALGVYPIINYYYECGGGYGASPYGTCPYGD